MEGRDEAGSDVITGQPPSNHLFIFLDVHGEMAGRSSNGNMGIDFYHQFKEDVKIMKKMGLEAFRFSISGCRVLPSGQLNLGIKKEGIQFYNNLIDDL
ncbi:hypothetical protein RHSIM_RhsimUnG0221300 [Rhododendron simsii]|uniref:Uncharacterized protein n=1 Tax=Rhododendron simsii TaxID=118357 RepID=A0A834L3G0_RHOSS|nr:hypothetical protein RHSIM_RhsimUnG0221300 [Rhododendron simsii]